MSDSTNGGAEVHGGRLAVRVSGARRRQRAPDAHGKIPRKGVAVCGGREAEVEIEHRPLLPFPVGLGDGQPLEEFAAPLEERL